MVTSSRNAVAAGGAAACAVACAYTLCSRAQRPSGRGRMGGTTAGEPPTPTRSGGTEGGEEELPPCTPPCTPPLNPRQLNLGSDSSDEEPGDSSHRR